VVKFQVITNNKCQVLWFSGPHIGSDNDPAIWNAYFPWFICKNRVRVFRLL
jgi:hypothetical protein